VNLLEFDVDDSANTATTIIIAYHNLGVECEYLGQKSEAMNAYKIGWKIARERLGPTHTLTQSLKDSLNDVGAQ
jgi:hypothetical protein